MMDVRPIRNESDYQWAMREVEPYFDKEPALGSQEGNRFEVLLTLINAYENEHYPIEPSDHAQNLTRSGEGGGSMPIGSRGGLRAKTSLDELRLRTSTADRSKLDTTTDADIEAMKAADGYATLSVPENARIVKPARPRKPIPSGPGRGRVHPGAILREDFLIPLGMPAEDLSRLAGIPADRVAGIVAECEALTAEVALRLGRLFGTTPEFWLNLQQSHDFSSARISLSAELDRVTPLEKYEFTLVASGFDPEAEDFESRIYDAGGVDATVAFQGDRTLVDFARMAESREAAIASATAIIGRAGGRAEVVLTETKR